MIMVGYTDNFNTYRFYDPENRHITISSDVTFLNTNAASYGNQNSNQASSVEASITIHDVTHSESDEDDDDGYIYDVPRL